MVVVLLPLLLIGIVGKKWKPRISQRILGLRLNMAKYQKEIKNGSILETRLTKDFAKNREERMISGFWSPEHFFPTMLLGLLLQSSSSSPTPSGLAGSLILMLAGIALARVYVNSTLKAHVAQKGKKDD